VNNIHGHEVASLGTQVTEIEISENIYFPEPRQYGLNRSAETNADELCNGSDRPLYASTGTQIDWNANIDLGEKRKSILKTCNGKITKQVRFDPEIQEIIKYGSIHGIKSKVEDESTNSQGHITFIESPTCIVQCELYENNLLPFQVDSNEFTAILDCGADVTVISYEFMKELQKLTKVEVMQKNIPGIKAVGEFVIQAYGTCVVPMVMQGMPFSITAKVLKRLKPKMILGNDFITKYKGVIDISKRNVQWTVKNVPVRAVQSIQVEPLQEVSIPVQIEGDLPVNLVGELTSGYGEEDPVMGARVVGKVHEGGMTAYRLCNMSEQPVLIQEGECVARFRSLRSGDIESKVEPDTKEQGVNHLSDLKPENRLEKHTEWFMLDSLRMILIAQRQAHSVQLIQSQLKPITDEDINLGGSYLTPDQKQQVIDLVKENRDVFAMDLSEIGCARGPPCRIHLKEGAGPVRCAPYKTSPIVQDKIDAELKVMLDNGIISYSDSEYASPIVAVTKPDGSLRICIDYRKLNEVSLFDAYPLPPINHAIDILGTARPKYLSILDMASGYWQIPIDPRDRHKTAFRTLNNLYEFNTVPFGLNSAGSKFVRYVNAVLTGILNKSAFAYVDDILVASPNFDQHLQDLTEVFDRFRFVNLRLKLKKCHFARREVKYLGHIVSAEGIQVDPSKIAPVASYPPPTDTKGVRRFLGLAGFYRRHVKGFSERAAPLSNLLKLESKFKWDDDCKKAMNDLKHALTHAPILGYPNYSEPYILTTDASGLALGGILSQVGENGVERIIAFHGKLFNRAEKAYGVSEKEALAIFDSLKHFRHYVQHAHVTIKTDHQPLKGLFQNEIQSKGRIAKWLAAMSQYDYSIEYVPGNKMGHADALSRRDYPDKQNEHERNPVVSPFFEMDEENMAKESYFPPLNVAVQTDSVYNQSVSQSTQVESGDRGQNSGGQTPPVDVATQTDPVGDQLMSQGTQVDPESEGRRRGSMEIDGQEFEDIFFLGGEPIVSSQGDVNLVSGIPVAMYGNHLAVEEIYKITTRSQIEAESKKDEQSQKDRLLNQCPQVNLEPRLNPSPEDSGDLTLDQLTLPELIQQQRADIETKQMIEYLEQGNLPSGRELQKTIIIQSSAYSVHEGILYHHTYPRNRSGPQKGQVFQIVIPQKFRKAILYDTHDSVMAGHRGVLATLLKIRERFYWRSMESDVATWIRCCPRCNQRGKRSDHKRAPLQPLEPEMALFSWQIDVAGPLARTPSGHRYILTCIDTYTKFVEYIPMRDISAVSVSRALFDQVFCRYGVCKHLQSDQGSNFLASITRSLCHVLGTQMQFSSAFHPISQGSVERDHGVLTDHLSKYIVTSGVGDDWDEFLAPAAFVHNNTIHATTKVIPNLLVFGRILKMPSEMNLPVPDALPKNLEFQIGHLIQKINECQIEADKNLLEARTKMKIRYDKKANQIEFRVGELVWLYVPNIPVQMTRKLRSSWVGPFRILNRAGNLNYEIRSEKTNKKLRFPVHVNRIRPYYVSSLRPPDDPELRDLYIREPDLHLTDQDLPEENYWNGVLHDGKYSTSEVGEKEVDESVMAENEKERVKQVPVTTKNGGQKVVLIPPTLTAQPGGLTVNGGLMPTGMSPRVFDPGKEVKLKESLIQAERREKLQALIPPPEYKSMVGGPESKSRSTFLEHSKPDIVALGSPSVPEGNQSPELLDSPGENEEVVMEGSNVPIEPIILPSIPGDMIPENRPFKTITCGKSDKSGTRFGIIYEDQADPKTPTWIPENLLTEEEKQFISDNPVRTLRPRTPRITYIVG